MRPLSRSPGCSSTWRGRCNCMQPAFSSAPRLCWCKLPGGGQHFDSSPQHVTGCWTLNISLRVRGLDSSLLSVQIDATSLFSSLSDLCVPSSRQPWLDRPASATAQTILVAPWYSPSPAVLSRHSSHQQAMPLPLPQPRTLPHIVILGKKKRVPYPYHFRPPRLAIGTCFRPISAALCIPCHGYLFQ